MLLAIVERLKARTAGLKEDKMIRVIVVGLMLMLSACTNATDVLCPPAGHCPNAPDGLGKDH
jgi:hypothetical protein